MTQVTWNCSYPFKCIISCFCAQPGCYNLSFRLWNSHTKNHFHLWLVANSMLLWEDKSYELLFFHFTNVTPTAFFGLLFASYLFFFFTLSLHVPFYLKWDSYRLYVFGSYFFIQFDWFCFLIGVFRPFILNVIITMIGVKMYRSDICFMFI